MTFRLFVAALCLSLLLTTPLRAQECVTCWSDKCPDSASYFPHCAAAKAAPPPERKPATKSVHNEPPLLTAGKLAVLEFDDKLRGADAHTDRTVFSDAVRAVAKRVSPGLFIMTRESILSLLKANGKKLEDCVGNCEVETGRLLGADYVVSGRLTKMGKRFLLTLRLHQTQSGELLSTGRAQGRTVEELDDATDEAAESLLRKQAKEAVAEADETPQPKRTKKVAATLTAAEPAPAKVAPKEEVQCPAGQSVGAETEGHCCWSGQVWGGGQCRGVPTSCPEGFQADGESCSQTPCDEGKERASAAHCCWPAQVWSKTRSQCVGIPRCPAGLAARGEGCGDARFKVEPKSGLEFVHIPGGSFHYGCEPQDTQCDNDEKPGRTVSLSTFWLGKTDVTVEAYRKCVTAGACSAANTDNDKCNYGKRATHPVNCLDWSQARTFCEWAGGRLPTAEEWEYAAKSGESRIYPWGDQAPNGQLAKYESSDGTAPAGSYAAGASKWGLLDMAGNVWQWTASDFDSSNKEIRGGCWNDPPQSLRASYRRRLAPADRYSSLGFRCGL